MYQSWDHLLFLHWEVPAEAIGRLLPPGLEVDLFEGRAYRGAGPVHDEGRPARPGCRPSGGSRTSTRPTSGRMCIPGDASPGVWFFSLDAANAVGAALGRAWFRLPYFFARMSLGVEESPGGLRLSYASDRLYPGPKPATTRVEAEVRSPVGPAAIGTLEYFLAERYLLYSASRGGGLFRGRVHHTPYPLQVAEVRSLEESMLAASGIERPDAPPLAHYARGVDVEVFGLERVGCRSGRMAGSSSPSHRKPAASPVSGEGDVELHLVALERVDGDRGLPRAGRPEVRAGPADDPVMDLPEFDPGGSRPSPTRMILPCLPPGSRSPTGRGRRPNTSR